MTPQRIASYKSRMYMLRKIGAMNSLLKVKKEALQAIDAADCDGQWIADLWFGRCAQKSFEDVIKILSSED